MVIKANSLKNAAKKIYIYKKKNIWNAAKYQIIEICRCYVSTNLFHSEKFVNSLVI